MYLIDVFASVWAFQDLKNVVDTRIARALCCPLIESQDLDEVDTMGNDCGFLVCI